jgi:hypothetical protein
MRLHNVRQFFQIAMVSPAMGSCEHTLNTLRYADRVKELGAGDPTKADGGSRGQEVRMDDGVISPEDSDLAQLRSMNEGELSADWYNFQVKLQHIIWFFVHPLNVSVSVSGSHLASPTIGRRSRRVPPRRYPEHAALGAGGLAAYRHDPRSRLRPGWYAYLPLCIM